MSRFFIHRPVFAGVIAIIIVLAGLLAANLLPVVMEAAMGGSLRQKLENAPKQRLALDEALRIFTQIGEALDFAHAKGVLHRAGWTGTVRVQGSKVTVTATGTRNPEFLGLLGVGAIRISETGSADAISTPDG